MGRRLLERQLPGRTDRRISVDKAAMPRARAPRWFLQQRSSLSPLRRAIQIRPECKVLYQRLSGRSRQLDPVAPWIGQMKQAALRTATVRLRFRFAQATPEHAPP